jgi:HAD superfamily hydrolase (TIGR01549 family)
MNFNAFYQIRGYSHFNSPHNSTKALIATQARNLHHFTQNDNGEQNLIDLVNSYPFTSTSEQITHKIANDFRHFFSSDSGDDITILPNALHALQQLRSAGVMIGVVSNSTLKSLQRDIGPLLDHMDIIVTDAKKPDTTAYLKALSQVGEGGGGVSPQRVCYVGDAASDIVMANAAGSVSVGVLSGMGTESQLRRSGAMVIANDLHDVVGMVCCAKLGEMRGKEGCNDTAV